MERRNDLSQSVACMEVHTASFAYEMRTGIHFDRSINSKIFMYIVKN